MCSNLTCNFKRCQRTLLFTSLLLQASKPFIGLSPGSVERSKKFEIRITFGHSDLTFSAPQCFFSFLPGSGRLGSVGLSAAAAAARSHSSNRRRSFFHLFFRFLSFYFVFATSVFRFGPKRFRKTSLGRLLSGSEVLFTKPSIQCWA